MGSDRARAPVVVVVTVVTVDAMASSFVLEKTAARAVLDGEHTRTGGASPADFDRLRRCAVRQQHQQGQ
jgi:hypothetical protein